MIERILADYSAAYSTKSVALRYFNACGADPDGETGEDHDPETHLIPRGLMAAAGEISHLDLYGTDYDTPDGTCIRDYIHVVDLANAHIKGFQWLELQSGPALETINVGTGHGVSVLEIIHTFEKVSGLQLNWAYGPRRSGDVEQIFADTTKAKNCLGWEAERSVEDAIVDAWNWQKKNGG